MAMLDLSAVCSSDRLGAKAKLTIEQGRLDMGKYSQRTINEWNTISNDKYSQRTINEWNTISNESVNVSSVNVFKNTADYA